MGFECVRADSEQTPIFAGKKTLSKSRAINSMRYIRSKVVREPITFTLSFCKLRNSIVDDRTMAPNDKWTWDDIKTLYRVFDVDDYCKLYFDDLVVDEHGIPTTDDGYQAYYNVIPFLDNETNMYIFANSTGYVDITFETDAGNAWIDMEATYTRTEDSQATPWMLPIPNISNVKNYEGDYKVYPYIKVELGEGCDYASFGAARTIDRDDQWIRLNFTSDRTLQGATIEIDGENRQYRATLQDGTEGDPSDVWNICDGELRFLFLEGSEEQIYHRSLVGYQCYPYTLTIKVAYPVNIAGLLNSEVLSNV